MVVEVLDQDSWVVIEKRNVYCNEHIDDLIETCQFSGEFIPHLPIKYINDYLVAGSKTHLKLRLINNDYYRFGCDHGLAVIFDDQYKIISIGVHQKSTLVSFGAKFSG